MAEAISLQCNGIEFLFIASAMFTPLCASSIQDCLIHLLSRTLCLESQEGYSPAHTLPPEHVVCAVHSVGFAAQKIRQCHK